MRGSYGNKRPANFNVSDCEIFYIYNENRFGDTSNILTKLDPTEILSRVPMNLSNSVSSDLFIDGLYEMKIPKSVLSQTGIYSFLVRPKEIESTIIDCGFLENQPNVKGIIVDLTREEFNGISSLDGYRIDFIENGVKIQNYYRIVSSSFRVEPVSSNSSSGNTSSTSKNIKYRPNDVGSLLFCIVSPSINNADAISGRSPILGTAGQTIIIANTFFDSVFFEIEVSDTSLERISNYLLGSQIKKMTSGGGQYAIYDKDGKLVDLFSLYQTKNQFGQVEFEIREKIDSTNSDLEDFETVKNESTKL